LWRQRLIPRREFAICCGIYQNRESVSSLGRDELAWHERAEDVGQGRSLGHPEDRGESFVGLLVVWTLLGFIFEAYCPCRVAPEKPCRNWRIMGGSREG